MKILTFTEFAAMPEGTIFSYYQPHFCEGLYRKGETLYGRESGALSILVPYDYHQLFAVYEEEDLIVLRGYLDEALEQFRERLNDRYKGPIG